MQLAAESGVRARRNTRANQQRLHICVNLLCSLRFSAAVIVVQRKDKHFYEDIDEGDSE